MSELTPEQMAFLQAVNAEDNDIVQSRGELFTEEQAPTPEVQSQPVVEQAPVEPQVEEQAPEQGELLATEEATLKATPVDVNPVGVQAVEAPSKASQVNTEMNAMLEEELMQQRAEDPTSRITSNNVLRDALQKTAQQAQYEAQRHSIEDLLAKTIIDPSNIVVVEGNKNIVEMQTSLNNLTLAATSPSYSVMALKSGYRAAMGALTNNDKAAMRNLSGSEIEQNEKLLRMVHRKIMENSTGERLSFEEWTSITAEADFETLLFGIYAATFPNETEYSVDCPKCAKANILKVRPEALIEAIDQEGTSNYIREVLDGYGKGREFMQNSELAKTTRVVLPESKIIVDVALSSLRGMLNTMSAARKLGNTYQAELVVLTKYIKGLYVPNLEALRQGKVEYFSVSDLGQIIRVMAENMSGKDLQELKKAIVKAESRYMVTYRLPKFTCANSSCGHQIDTSVDVTRLVFTGIAVEGLVG